MFDVALTRCWMLRSVDMRTILGPPKQSKICDLKNVQNEKFLAFFSHKSWIPCKYQWILHVLRSRASVGKNGLQPANVLEFTGQNARHWRALPRRPSQQQCIYTCCHSENPISYKHWQTILQILSGMAGTKKHPPPVAEATLLPGCIVHRLSLYELSHLTQVEI